MCIELTKDVTINRGSYKKGEKISVSESIRNKLVEDGKAKDCKAKK